jgi:hypothetical protein
MKLIENECVGCPPGVPCLGSSCPNRNVPHYYCDECHEEATLYEFNGLELCLDCIAKRLDVVEGSE